MASRLAGRAPVAQPAVAASTPRDARSEELNGRVSAVPLPVDLEGTQTEYGATDGAGGQWSRSRKSEKKVPGKMRRFGGCYHPWYDVWDQ